MKIPKRDLSSDGHLGAKRNHNHSPSGACSNGDVVRLGDAIDRDSKAAGKLLGGQAHPFTYQWPSPHHLTRCSDVRISPLHTHSYMVEI